MVKEVFLPKLSDNMESGVIIAWLVHDGDRVEKGQAILEVETDKAAVELEAPESGFLRGIRPGMDAGVTVAVGETIAFIAQAPDEPLPSLSLQSAAQPPPLTALGGSTTAVPGFRTSHTGSPMGLGLARATPAVRRKARVLGIDLRAIQGTGPEGRVTEGDLNALVDESARAAGSEEPSVRPVLDQPISATGEDRRSAHADLGGAEQITTSRAVEGVAPETLEGQGDSAMASEARSAPPADGEWLDLTRAQQSTGQRMLQSVQSIPQFSLTTSVDMTRALEARDAQAPRIEHELGFRLSVTGILIRIAADALRQCRRVNASFVAGRLLLHRHVNIGVAIGADDGLVVPVIRDADQKSLVEITRELGLLQRKAGQKRFRPDDLVGATFTVSNLGMFGVDSFQAIINPPESAILAVGRILRIPAGMPEGGVALRPMMPLTLSIDHRCLDGKQGAEFLAQLRQGLEEPEKFF